MILFRGGRIFRGGRSEEGGVRLQSEARGLFTVYSLQFTDDYIKR